MGPYGHNQADALATYFHGRINEALQSDWIFFFKYPGTLELRQIRDVKKAAYDLLDAGSYLLGRLTKPCPELEDLPKLRAQILMEYDRLGIPFDLESYARFKVLPQFQEREDYWDYDDAARDIVECIQDFQGFISETIETIEKLLGMPRFPSLSSCKLEISQIRTIFEMMVKKEYITPGTWDDFSRCFDSLAVAPGWIHWIKAHTVKHKGREIRKQPILWFLFYFNVRREEWQVFAATLFHVNLTYNDTQKVKKRIEDKEPPSPGIFWDLDKIASFNGKKYW